MIATQPRITMFKGKSRKKNPRVLFSFSQLRPLGCPAIYNEVTSKETQEPRTTLTHNIATQPRITIEI